ncbi:MAG: SGNH/GDSL hydrolase family protein [Acutalibacteraceae bacterium]
MIDFKQFNEVAKENGVVFFGSTYFESVPVNELAQDFDTQVPVYNRSVSGLTIDKVSDVLESCVLELSPSKLFICLGDEDIKTDSFNLSDFIEKYQWMLYTLHNRCSAKIYIISVMSLDSKAAATNERLKKLADETGCIYVDTQSALKSAKSTLRFFSVLRYFMRNHPITFNEAMMA